MTLPDVWLSPMAVESQLAKIEQDEGDQFFIQVVLSSPNREEAPDVYLVLPVSSAEVLHHQLGKGLLDYANRKGLEL